MKNALYIWKYVNGAMALLICYLLITADEFTPIYKGVTGFTLASFFLSSMLIRRVEEKEKRQ